jgi:hypothetical protein
VSTLPMVFDDGTSAMVPQEKIQAAMQDGGKLVQPMMFDDGSRAMVPLEKVHDAMQDGGQVMGQSPQRPSVNMQPDNTGAFSENRFTITPQPGEDFSDTMRRAAKFGKTVTPAEVSSQGLKGLQEVPAVLAAGAAGGMAQPAAMATLGSLLAPTAGRTLFEAQGPSLLSQGATALAPIVKKYGIKALEGAGLGAGLGLYKELKNVFEGTE